MILATRSVQDTVSYAGKCHIQELPRDKYNDFVYILAESAENLAQI